MSDFLSSLLKRSFTDAPMIRPRVPSLFEPTSVNISEGQQSSTPARISESSSVQEIGIAKPIAPVNGIAEEQLSKTVASRPKAVAAETSRERKRIVVPVTLSHGEEGHPTNTREIFEPFSERGDSRLPRRDFSAVDQRSSNSAPTIRVTIGRVEVRAVQSPPPRPKQAKPEPPKLSLEEYLRKRAGGSR